MSGPEPRHFASFPLAEFAVDRWAYEPGQHVTILGPTGSGKTFLAYTLLGQTATPELPGIVLVMKPRDKTAASWNKRLGFKIVREWPPPRIPKVIKSLSPFDHKEPRGYTLWPKHSMESFASDNRRLQKEFHSALIDSYRKGDRILFADEVAGLSNELKLDVSLTGIWQRGRSMGCGLWAASQRPTHIPLLAYSQAEHVFIAYDPDVRAQERYGEIGGVDPKEVRSLVAKLPKYHWLYIRRSDRAMCIITPENGVPT